MIVKLINLFNYISFLPFRYLVRRKKVPVNSGTMLIIRLDAMGDYILFRNFLEVLKKNGKYAGFRITLCGNIEWKNLAEVFDKEFIEEFIWIDRKKFYNNFFYKYHILTKIHNSGFEVVINSAYTREILFGDLIVKVSDAKERIGCSGSLDKHAKWKRALLSDSYYTTLFNSKNENLFEFYRNKEFFENLLNRKLSIGKHYFNTGKLNIEKITGDKYVILVPGAKDKERIWDMENFVSVSQFIIKNYKLKVIVSGSENEKMLAETLISKLNPDYAYNLAGKVSLSSLVKYIEDAELLLSNETGPVHIAAAVNTPVICISNGNHLGRFNPYPKEIFQNAYYIYPHEVENIINSGSENQNNLRFKSEYDINEITPDRVKEVINKILEPNA